MSDALNEAWVLRDDGTEDPVREVARQVEEHEQGWGT